MVPFVVTDSLAYWENVFSHAELDLLAGEDRAGQERLAAAVHGINNRQFQFALDAAAAFRMAGEAHDWRLDHDVADPHPVKLVFCLQLTDPSAYHGGDFELQEGRLPTVAPRTRGTLIVFPAFLPYRVTPLVQGTRKSLMGHMKGPGFR